MQYSVVLIQFLVGFHASGELSPMRVTIVDGSLQPRRKKAVHQNEVSCTAQKDSSFAIRSGDVGGVMIYQVARTPKIALKPGSLFPEP